MSTWHEAAAALANKYTQDHWRDTVLTNEETFINVVKEIIRVTDTPGSKGPRQLPSMDAGRRLLEQLADPNLNVQFATKPLAVELDLYRKEHRYGYQHLANLLHVSKSLIRKILSGDTTPRYETLLSFGETLKGNEFFFIETRAHLLAAITYELAYIKPGLATSAIATLKEEAA